MDCSSQIFGHNDESVTKYDTAKVVGDGKSRSLCTLSLVYIGAFFEISSNTPALMIDSLARRCRHACLGESEPQEHNRIF
jgi:hypothetical protein